MTSKSLRRLASDHASLHTKGLPPNYLFPPGKEDTLSDLTSLTVLLAGPQGTPFQPGLYTLELSIPPTYPTTAPTAHFRTRIFHPNVDPSTGAICVETLKRDWRPDLTLRDVLVTVGCLLVFPNPASALNAEAGRLVDEEFEEYERKAGLWARMHAAVPVGMRALVEEARRRGDEGAEGEAGPVEKVRRRRERDVKKVEGDDVFVREDSIQKTPPKQSTSEVCAPAPAPAMKGLGIDILPESSLNTHNTLETPTQPGAPTRRRRKQANDEEQATTTTTTTQPSSSLAPTSFATPTPAFKPLLHSNPSTPRLGQPDSKRRRVTPPEQENTPPVLPQKTRDEDEDERPWVHWQTRSPYSSPEGAEARRKRRKIVGAEELEDWNRGVFGPRRGVERL